MTRARSLRFERWHTVCRMLADVWVSYRNPMQLKLLLLYKLKLRRKKDDMGILEYCFCIKCMMWVTMFIWAQMLYTPASEIDSSSQMSSFHHRTYNAPPPAAISHVLQDPDKSQHYSLRPLCTVKKAFRLARLQPGCHLPNCPWAGII